MKFEAKDLQYVILPGRFCSQSHLEIYDQTFDFWQQNWLEVYKELGSDKAPHPNDFFRQDFIPVILHGRKVVAIHLYTLYDLRPRCTKQHSYLHDNFNEMYFARLKKMKLNKVMSMEALFVRPDYRKSVTGVQLSEVLITLGQRIFSEYTDADAIIAPSRLDMKVAQTAAKLGFEPVIETVELNNVPVQLQISRRGKIVASESESTRTVAAELWKRLVFAQEKPITKPIAA